MSNLLIINVMNTSIRQRIFVDLEYQVDIEKLLSKKAKNTFRISTYFDMILMQDS